jgi:hypothetical protein
MTGGSEILHKMKVILNCSISQKKPQLGGSAVSNRIFFDKNVKLVLNEHNSFENS